MLWPSVISIDDPVAQSPGLHWIVCLCGESVSVDDLLCEPMQARFRLLCERDEIAGVEWENGN